VKSQAQDVKKLIVKYEDKIEVTKKEEFKIEDIKAKLAKIDKLKDEQIKSLGQNIDAL